MRLIRFIERHIELPPWRFVIIGSAVVLLFCLLFFASWMIPVRARLAVYQPVDGDVWMERSELVFRKTPPLFYPEAAEFLVENDRLYLLKQTQRGAFFLSGYVNTINWTAESIREFRQNHPELESYWPNPSEPSGGVKWAWR